MLIVWLQFQGPACRACCRRDVSEPLPPPWTPSSIAAVQLPGAPGDASPRTPQQREAQAAPATPTAPHKARRPAVWPAAVAHAARRTLHYGEP